MIETISSSVKPDDIATGGIREGTNLFYSFNEFSVAIDEEIFFADTEEIDNIFIRVIGDSLTVINGLVKTENDTNVFLINPRGIIFEAGASLDIDGDFVGSTAESILFPDNLSFSADNNELQTVLSNEIPLGLNFGSNPTAIEIDLDSSLSPNEEAVLFGDNLTLLGGDINIRDSKLSSETITLGTLDDSGTINLENSNLSFPENITKGDINITLGSELIVTGDGDSFELIGDNFTLDDTSEIVAGENNEIKIQVDDSIFIDNGSSLFSNGGNINVFGKNITLNNESTINSNQGEQPGGNITINAIESITLNDKSNLGVSTGRTGSELIIIDASDLRIDSNEGVVVTPISSGENTNGGSITIETGDIVITPGDLQISTSIYRLKNSNVPGAYIYVATEERNSILNNYPNFIDEGFAFQAGISPGDNLEPIYRFQSLETPGSYHFVGESERQEIKDNFADTYFEEGLAFYVYGVGSNLGEEFSRFRHSEQPGGYILAAGVERDNIRANLSEWIDEGIAFEAL